MKTNALLFVLTAAGTHLAHVSLSQVERPKQASLREALPTAAATRLMSLGYHSLLADYYWLRSISHFGTTEMHAAAYPNLEPLIRLVLGLDPYFRAAYILAGTALTVRGQDPQASVELLKQGLQYRGQDWRIGFLLGFNQYHFLGQYAEAARVFAKTATLPGAPDHLGPLAARLAAEAGEPELGLQLMADVLRVTDDPKMREVYEQRRTLLELELHLKWLNRAAAEFRIRHGRPPQGLAELVRVKMLTGIPQEPLGGRFFVGTDGTVQTTNDAARLRLPAKAKAAARAMERNR